MADTRAAYIGCSDGRLCLHHLELLAWLGFDLTAAEVDMILVPGGGATTSPQHRDDLRALFDLHRFAEVILVAHHDCGKVADHEDRLQNLKDNIRWIQENLKIGVRAFIQHTHTAAWDPCDPYDG